MEEQTNSEQLTRKERRALKRERRANKKSKENKSALVKKIGLFAALGIAGVVVAMGIRSATRETPEEIVLNQKVEEASLEGKVQEFEIEGREHVNAGVEVEYNTNPPSSGNHYSVPADWGVYSKELNDKSAIHALEHGGIWISYKDISDEEKTILEKIGKQNSNSTVVSPRASNDNKIEIVSWGRMMKLTELDQASIQKYIDTYKNQSPERLAR